MSKLYLLVKIAMTAAIQQPYIVKRGTLEGSTLEDVRVDPATQHNNTSHRRLYEISVGSTYMCRSERCRSVLLNTIFEVLDISRSYMPVYCKTGVMIQVGKTSSGLTCNIK